MTTTTSPHRKSYLLACLYGARLSLIPLAVATIFGFVDFSGHLTDQWRDTLSMQIMQSIQVAPGTPLEGTSALIEATWTVISWLGVAWMLLIAVVALRAGLLARRRTQIKGAGAVAGLVLGLLCALIVPLEVRTATTFYYHFGSGLQPPDSLFLSSTYTYEYVFLPFIAVFLSIPLFGLCGALGGWIGQRTARKET